MSAMYRAIRTLYQGGRITAAAVAAAAARGLIAPAELASLLGLPAPEGETPDLPAADRENSLTQTEGEQDG